MVEAQGNIKKIQVPKRKPARLKEYDYSAAGYYFATICSMNHRNIFSKIVGTGLVPVRLELTTIGQIINNHWSNIPNQYDNVNIDEFIIMPNHIHGILIINKRDKIRAETSPAPTISHIICSFKSICAVEYIKHIKQNKLKDFTKIWQRSFYDHVIRNEKSLEEIREYIVNNPAKWNDDEYNVENYKSMNSACLSTTLKG